MIDGNGAVLGFTYKNNQYLR